MYFVVYYAYSPPFLPPSLHHPPSTPYTVCGITQRYLALDDRIAWAYYEFSTDLLSGETIEEWVALSGKQGEGQEGNINIILSFTVRHASYSSGAIIC